MNIMCFYSCSPADCKEKDITCHMLPIGVIICCPSETSRLRSIKNNNKTKTLAAGISRRAKVSEKGKETSNEGSVRSALGKKKGKKTTKKRRPSF